MSEKLKVELSASARAELEVIVRQSSAGVAKVRWARILLMADEAHPEGRRCDWEIAEAVGISERQIVRIRQKFVREGIHGTLERSTRSDAGAQKALDGKAEAHLVRLACSSPPEGRDRWTLDLLVDELCRLQVVPSVSRETVRRSLKKMNYSLGKRSDSAFRKRTAHASSRAWKQSSTSTTRRTTIGIR